MDLDRDIEEFVDAVVDRAGLRPRRHDIDGVGPQGPRRVDRLAQVGGQRVAPLLARGGRVEPRQRGRADGVQPEVPWLIAPHEGADILAAADQEHTLRGDQSHFAAEDHGRDQRVARQDQGGQAGHVEQQHRAARIVHRHLGEEREREQHHEGDVPIGERAPDMRLEVEVVIQVVFAAEDPRHHEDTRRHQADAGEAAQRLDAAIDHQVIPPADRDAEADDDHRVRQDARHADGVARERTPSARRPRRHQQRMRQNGHGTAAVPIRDSPV